MALKWAETEYFAAQYPQKRLNLRLFEDIYAK